MTNPSPPLRTQDALLIMFLLTAAIAFGFAFDRAAGVHTDCIAEAC